MEKILRLSFANIKKHKKQTILLTLMIVTIIIMILFCFGCAYVGAGRIKKIFVTELMTE